MKKIILFLLLFFSVASAQNTLVRKEAMNSFVRDTAQNINAQYNFLANAKFGSDSSIFVSKDSTVHTRSSALSTYNPLKVYPYNTVGTAPMSIFTGEYDFGGGVTDHIMGWGYHRTRYNYTEPRGYWTIEGNYFNSGNPVLETYFDIFDSTATYNWRPLTIAYYRKTNYLSVGFPTDMWSIGKKDNTSWVEAYTDSTVSSLNGANSYMRFYDSTALDFSINNYPFLFQAQANGTPRELLRLNAQNNLEITPNTTSNLVLNNNLTSKYSGVTPYGLDTGMVNIGNSTKDNNGLAIVSSTGTSGSMIFDGSESTLRLMTYNGQSPFENYNSAFGNFDMNLALGGNIGLGTKSWEAGNTNTLYLLNGTAPTTALSGGVKVYSDGGELKVMNSSGTITGLSGGSINFFNHNPNGGVRNRNPYLENYLYAATSRFTVSDTGFSAFNGGTTESILFDNKYETYATIDAADTGKIYIDLDGRNEMDSSLAYAEGYFLVHVFGSANPISVSGDVYYTAGGWTPMTSATNISNNSADSLFRLTVPSTNYAREFRIFVVAGGSIASVGEIEYYPNRAENTVNISPVVNKSGANSLYNKLSFKDWNNTEKAYIDSNGNAYFQDLTVINTITVSDSIVTQSYTTDTLTVNNISNLAAATASTLTVGTITSINGRIQPATGGQIELDSLRNRLAMLDTLTFAFGIADAADGSYSTAIFIPNAITVNKVMAVLRTSATSNDSAYVNIYFGSSVYSGASTVWSADKNLSDTTSGHSYTSFDDATIPTNSWMWLQCNNEVETVNQINVTVFAKKD